jgi:S-adenosyl methyltransferase
MQAVHEAWAKALDTKVLGPAKPITVTMVAMVHFVPDELGVHEAVAGYREFLPPGSRRVINHATEVGVPQDLRAPLRRVVRQYEESSPPVLLRDPGRLSSFFGDVDLVEPGLVWLPEWHVDERTSPHTAENFRDDPAHLRSRRCVASTAELALVRRHGVSTTFSQSSFLSRNIL